MNCKAQKISQVSSEQPRPNLQVAVVQFKGDRGDYAHNQNRLLQTINEAGERGVDVIVAPECVCSEYSFTSIEEAKQYAEDVSGDFAKALIKCAVTQNIWCFVGTVEKGEGGHLFNSVFIASPQGDLQVYRKRLLFDADEVWATSGDLQPISLPEHLRLSAYGLSSLDHDPSPPYPLFNIEGWRVTVGICMDLNDPRFLEFCSHTNVDLIAFPTNWIDEGKPVINYWAALLQGMTRATLLAANSYGVDGDYTLSGHSAILQASPPTLLGEAPKVGDYLITCTLDYLIPLHPTQKELNIE